MTDNDISAQIAQVDRMLDRVDKIVGRERPEKVLRPDVSYPRQSRRSQQPVHTSPPQSPRVRSSPLRPDVGYSADAIASGSLAGNEMRLADYRPQPREDDDPTGMWAAFESDFDDMVAGMH